MNPIEQDDMIRDRSQKQAMCYCGRRATIQYGLKWSPLLQLIFYPPTLVVFFYAAFFSEGELWARIGLLLLLSILLFVIPLGAFVETKKRMLKTGHSRRCSQHVALREMMYTGRFSRFAIIDHDDGSKSKVLK